MYKMRQLHLSIALLLVGAVFLGSCIEPNKDIKYNKYTKADTEAFVFLKKTYEEALFQQYAVKNYNLGAESQKVADEYQALTQELVDLATKNNVLMPNFAITHFDEKAAPSINSFGVIADTTSTDSLVANSAIVQEQSQSASKESASEKVIHSQEDIVHQFEVASRNTNVSIRDFAASKVEGLKELLEYTKSSIK
jgi:hypothetical protein